MEENDVTITSNDVTVILNDEAMGEVLEPENENLQKEPMSDSSTVKTGTKSKKKQTGAQCVKHLAKHVVMTTLFPMFGSKKKKGKGVITINDDDSEIIILNVSQENKKAVVEEIIIDSEDIQIQVIKEVISLDIKTKMSIMDDSDEDIGVIMSPRQRTSSGYPV